MDQVRYFKLVIPREFTRELIGTDGANRQRLALEAEGVDVTVGRAGEFRVDFRTCGWFPASIAPGLEAPDDPAQEP